MIEIVLSMTLRDWIRFGSIVITLAAVVLFLLMLAGVFDDNRQDL